MSIFFSEIFLKAHVGFLKENKQENRTKSKSWCYSRILNAEAWTASDFLTEVVGEIRDLTVDKVRYLRIVHSTHVLTLSPSERSHNENREHDDWVQVEDFELVRAHPAEHILNAIPSSTEKDTGIRLLGLTSDKPTRGFAELWALQQWMGFEHHFFFFMRILFQRVNCVGEGRRRRRRRWMKRRGVVDHMKNNRMESTPTRRQLVKEGSVQIFVGFQLQHTSLQLLRACCSVFPCFSVRMDW